MIFSAEVRRVALRFFIVIFFTINYRHKRSGNIFFGEAHNISANQESQNSVSHFDNTDYLQVNFPANNQKMGLLIKSSTDKAVVNGLYPSSSPTGIPTSFPTLPPTIVPTAMPTTAAFDVLPSVHPANIVSEPTQFPTEEYSTASNSPTVEINFNSPSSGSTDLPETMSPISIIDSFDPSSYPTRNPSAINSIPISEPSVEPTIDHVSILSQSPTYAQSTHPSPNPMVYKSSLPSTEPSMTSTVLVLIPSIEPSQYPSIYVSSPPAQQPSALDLNATIEPTYKQSNEPSLDVIPSAEPSQEPSMDATCTPTHEPSASGVSFTMEPTYNPSYEPSLDFIPSANPSHDPSTELSTKPTTMPTYNQSNVPSLDALPSTEPSQDPSIELTSDPTTVPTHYHSIEPSIDHIVYQSALPSSTPTNEPSHIPSIVLLAPSIEPSPQPSIDASSTPTHKPSALDVNLTTEPSNNPTYESSLDRFQSSVPSSEPTVSPTSVPSTEPSELISTEPNQLPTLLPSLEPSSDDNFPTVEPSSEVINSPFTSPSFWPTKKFSFLPSFAPSSYPSQSLDLQSIEPSMTPSLEPSIVPSNSLTFYPTVDDSQEPLISPSVAPTSNPFTQISSYPQSLEPSCNPSKIPSIEPSQESSTYPTVWSTQESSPTLMPTVFVTEITSQPSMLSPSPSALSTQKTIPPWIQPSSQPTSHPTSQPSSQPSLEPSSQPTYQPTVQPSLVLPLDPTRDPTLSSSFSPETPQPSSWPTGYPSSIPTRTPMSNPTGIPSSYPSQQPSAGSFQVAVLIESYLEATISTSDAAYSEVASCDGRVVRNIVGWSNFISKISSLSNNYIPSTMTFYSVSESCYVQPADAISRLSQKSYTCTNKDSLQLIWSAVIKSVDAVVSCDGHVWNVKICSDFTAAICRSCSDPCSSTAVNQSLPITASLPVLDQVRGYAISFAISEKPSLWPTWTQSCTAGDDLAVVSYSLMSSGTLTCNIFLNTTSRISSFAEIKVSGSTSSAYFNTGGSGNITFSRLQSSKSYQILCYSESFQQISDFIFRSPMTQVYNLGCVVTTTCCQKTVITLSKSFSTISEYQISRSIIVTLSILPTDSVYISPVVQYIGENVCSAYANQTIEPSYTSNVLIAPSQLDFTKSSASAKAFFIQPLSGGCYFVSTNISGPSATQFALNNDASSIVGVNSPSGFYYYVIDAIETSNDIQVSYIAFIGTGSQMVVKFSADTDAGVTKGLSSGSWNCDILLDFNSSTYSTCRFSTLSTVIVTFPLDYTVSLPELGSLITVRGGVVKYSCTNLVTLSSYSSDICAGLNYIQEQVVAVTTLVTVTPQVSISAATILAYNTSLVIDTTSSTGSGGRAWSKIVWTVMNVTGDRFTEMENYMNSLPWFNCAPGSFRCNVVPASFLTIPGYYVLTLTLENFFGIRNFATHVLTIQDRSYIPAVSILGPSTSYVYANMTLVLQAQVQVSAEDTVSFSWSVYRDGSLDNSIPASSLSALQVDKYQLLPNHEYVFEVAIKSTTFATFSLATKTIIVLPGDIIPVLSGGNAYAIYSTDTLRLDASKSYETSTGSSSSLTFTWSCVQVSPLSSTGCSNFLNELISTNQINNPTVAVPASVFASSSTYRLYVDLQSSLIPSVTVRQYQSVSVLSNSTLLGSQMISPPTISIQSYAISVDNSIQTTISSVVSYSSAFVATWSSVSTTNRINSTTTLQISSFPSGGAISFPLLISANSLQGGQQYTFQLSILSYDTCNGCILSYSQVRIAVNQPPQSGTFACEPSSGYDNTLFSLYASNWQDLDLPLTYSFFQYDYKRSNNILIKQKSPISFLNTYLSPGDSLNNNITDIIAYIIDSYSCKTTATTQVNIVDISEYISTLPSEAVSYAVETNALSYAVTSLSVSAAQKNPDIALAATNVLVRSSLSSTCSSLASNSSECYAFATVGISATKQVLALSNTNVDTMHSLTLSLAVLSTNKVISGNITLVTGSIETAAAIATSLHGLSISDSSTKTSLASAFYSAADNIALAAFSTVISSKNTFQRSSRILPMDNETTTDSHSLAFKYSYQLSTLSTEDRLSSLQKTLESSIWSMTTTQFNNLLVGESPVTASTTYFDIYCNRQWQNRKEHLWNIDNMISLTDLNYNSSSDTVMTIGYSVFRSRLNTYQSTTLKSSSSIYSQVTIDSDRLLINPSISTVYASIANTATNTNLTASSMNLICNGKSDYVLTIHCPANETGGLDYNMQVQCYQNKSELVNITCPTYQWTTVCAADSVSSCVAHVNVDGSTTCQCDSNTLNYSSNSLNIQSLNYNHFRIKSYFEMKKILMVLTHESTSRGVIVSPIFAIPTSSSSRSSFNYIAIIVLSVCFFMAAGCGAKKLYEYTSNNIIPIETTAVVVQPNDNQTDEEQQTDSDIVNVDVDVVNFEDIYEKELLEVIAKPVRGHLNPYHSQSRRSSSTASIIPSMSDSESISVVSSDSQSILESV